MIEAGTQLIAMHPTPSPLFKFMQRVHCEAALTEGAFRIGTLLSFRDEETHGSSVGDSGEGKKTHFLSSPAEESFDLLSDDPRAEFARRVIHGWQDLPPGSSVKIVMKPKSGLEHYEESPDCYVFCASTKYEPASIATMGYNSCLRIDDPYRFFASLSESLIDKGTFAISAPIIYSDRRQPFDATLQIHPALLKPASYSYQNEFRAIWTPTVSSITPLVVRSLKAARYCSLVNN